MAEISGWRTSSRSQGQGQCVEVGFGPDHVGVRDTKNRGAGRIEFASQLWQEFVGGLKSGRFDLD
ncbi:DUF397 domain-containing protein [Saccharopolyspora terrae]|jgi:hypothetical protein|uniref:DUF397 domain-containing protein n=1 Tax=Saccharopolyspora terrae TaxID=2530384 RepID=A0A4R4VFC0_9PSEU|nr:DUF397 domain-containing protein [Saccharopolyspora terrae]TDD04248.1 DUF397 domain-containing protein [Saccharopolyspora terrae]